MQSSLKIVTVGKLKEAYWRDACAEYRKRLSAWSRVEIVELPESRLPDSPSEKSILAALAEEGRGMEAQVREGNAFRAALCVEGLSLDSPALAQRLEQAALEGKSTAYFFIGSSFGLAPEIKAKAELCLSMSRMTFPHQLARVMLLEQLYRAAMIQNGSKYHK